MTTKPETAPHGDAELLRLGDELRALLEEIDAGGHRDAGGDPRGVSGYLMEGNNRRPLCRDLTG